MDLPEIADYKTLFLNNTRMIDVRAPVEFSQGSFPEAQNLPLMNDAERQAVGLRYKEQGQDKAIELGHQLVSGEVKEQRVNDWSAFIQQNPAGVLYCFRGGLRSKISQQWIFEKTGIMYPRIKGGYKALRRYLINELENAAVDIQPIMLGGRTGTGKTLLLNQLHDQIDLEGIFNHRGSVFGKHVKPQPSQIDIENSLSIALLKLRHQGIQQIVMEDEGANIGSRDIPKSLFNKMKQSPLILLEASLDTRVDIIFNEYIIEALAEHQNLLGETAGFDSWACYLLNALERTQRRLGGERYKAFKQIMEDALEKQQRLAEPEHHKVWIRQMLSDYYDPMYDYQLSKKTDRVILQAESAEILAFLQQTYQIR